MGVPYPTASSRTGRGVSLMGTFLLAASDLYPTLNGILSGGSILSALFIQNPPCRATIVAALLISLLYNVIPLQRWTHFLPFAIRLGLSLKQKFAPHLWRSTPLSLLSTYGPRIQLLFLVKQLLIVRWQVPAAIVIQQVDPVSFLTPKSEIFAPISLGTRLTT